MSEAQPLFDMLRQTVQPEIAGVLERFVREAPDRKRRLVLAATDRRHPVEDAAPDSDLILPVDLENLNGPGDVLQVPLAEAGQREGHLAVEMFAHRPGNTYARRSGDLLQARSDIDPVAEQIVSRHDDVAEIDPDAKLQAAFRGQILHIEKTALDFHRAADRLNRAWKLGDETIAGTAEDAAAMVTHQFGNPPPAPLERAKRVFFVKRCEAAEAGDIGRKDGCKLSIHNGDRSCGGGFR